MKKTLEKITNTGKKVLDHIKENAKVYTLMASASIAGKVYADGKVDLWNWSNSATSGEEVDIYENDSDTDYIEDFGQELHTYLSDDPNGINNPLRGAGINSPGFFSKKMFLKADSDTPNGSDNMIDINCNAIKY